MTTKYEQVKSVHDRAVETNDANELRKIPLLLNSWGIKCREDDGQLLWTNLSVPTSVGEAITIGLRYKKQDKTLSEDVFELNNKNPDVVTSYYKGCYQTLRPEYQQTHKLQNVGAHSFTTVNTCCLFLGNNNCG
jgi:hypothetical protein